MRSPRARQHRGVWRALAAASALAFGALPVEAAPGDLDPGFDGDGLAFHDVFPDADAASDLVVFGRGEGQRSISVGSSTIAGRTQAFIARSDARGDLDPGFADGHGFTLAWFDDSAVFTSVVRDSSGRLLVAGAIDNSTGAAEMLVARYTARGHLDVTFDSDGWTTVEFDFESDDIAYDIALQEDGRIVLVGDALVARDVGVARLTAAGAPDTTFSDDGRVTFPWGSVDHAAALAIQHNGRIVVAGSADEPTDDSRMALARLHPNGALDTAFEGDGKVLFDMTPGDDNAEDVDAIGTPATIYVAGTLNPTGDSRAFVARYLTDGSRDESYANPPGSVSFGFQTVGSSGMDFFGSDTLVTGSGAYLVGHATFLGGGAQFVARLTSSGELVTSWGDGGILGTVVGRAIEVSRALLHRGDIVTTGAIDWSTSAQPAADVVLTRLAIGTGVLRGLGGDGIAAVDIAQSSDSAEELVIRPDGSMVVLGQSHSMFDSSEVIVQLEADGSIDRAFGQGDGALQFPEPTAGTARPLHDIAVDGDATYVVGTVHSAGDRDFYVALTDDTGTTFDDATLEMTDCDDGLALTALDAGGVVVAGATCSGDNSAFGLVKLSSSLGTDLGFGVSGRAVANFTPERDAVVEVVELDDGRLLAVGTADVFGESRIAVARFTATGAPDSTFGGGDGKAAVGLGPASEDATDVVVLPSGAFVVAGYRLANGFDPILVKFTDDGALDRTWGGGDGWVSGGTPDRDERGFAVARDDDARYVVVGTSEFGDFDSRVLIQRFEVDGSLDTSFSGNGHAVLPPAATGDSSAWDVDLFGGDILFVGQGGAITLGGDLVVGRVQP